MITTEPNALMATIHERMPVIVPQASWDRWLGESGAAPPADVLGAYPADAMTAWPVSTLVNAPGREDPRLVEPLVA